MNANGQMPVQTDDSDNPVVLIVGKGPLSTQLKVELKNFPLDAETAESNVVVEAVVAAAPDLVVLVGDAARDDGKEILQQLTDNPAGAVVPIVVLSTSKSKDTSRAFRHGVVSTIVSDTPVNEIAERIATLVNELPERPGECAGAVEEATLDELVSLLTNELRSGVLSVKSEDDKRNEQGARIVLRAGHSVSEEVDSFVERVKPLIAENKEVSYAFQENSCGRVDSVAPPGDPSQQGAESESLTLERRRILVVDSERTRADKLAKVLREHKALVVTVCGTEVDLERARSLDPEVVIVDSYDIDGACSQVIETFQQDIRMRWASVLVSTKEQIWSDDQEQPNISPLANKIAQLNMPDEQLRKRAKSSKSFDTRLEIVGPSRMLRALAASGKTLRVSVKHPRATIDIEVADDTVLGAKGILKEDDSRSVSGTTALSAFMALASGRVRVSEVSAPELSDLLSPIDLMLSMAAAEASPIALSIPPQPLVSRPIELTAQPPLVIEQDGSGPQFAGLQKVPGSVSSVSTMIIDQPPADPIEPSMKPKSRSNWWLGKAVPVTGAFTKDDAPQSFGRSDEDTQEVLVHQSLLEDSEQEPANAVSQSEAPVGYVDSASAELAATSPFGASLHWERLKQTIENIRLRLRSMLIQYASTISKTFSNRTQRVARISFPSAIGDTGARIGAAFVRIDARFRGFVRRFNAQAISQLLQKSRERLLQLPRRTTIIVIAVTGLLICFAAAASFLLYKDKRPASQPEPRLNAAKIEHKRSDKIRAENKTAAEALTATEPTKEVTEQIESRHHLPEQNTQDELDEPPLETEVVTDSDEPIAADKADEMTDDEPGEMTGDEPDEMTDDEPDEMTGDEPDKRDDRISGDSADGSKRFKNRDRIRRIREADKFVTEGHRYWRRGRLGMAESSYLQALQVYPKYPRALVGMVRVHLQRRASVEALRAAKMLVNRKPQPSLYHLLLGDAYALDGNLASARTEWRIASRRGSKTARSRLRAKDDQAR